jgi:hypothetical protein
MKENWNPNDHQGKSRFSLETSYRILFVCIMIASIVCTWGLIIELIKIIF